jgi:hypothetical protein
MVKEMGCDLYVTWSVFHCPQLCKNSRGSTNIGIDEISVWDLDFRRTNFFDHFLQNMGMSCFHFHIWFVHAMCCKFSFCRSIFSFFGSDQNFLIGI